MASALGAAAEPEPLPSRGTPIAAAATRTSAPATAVLPATVSARTERVVVPAADGSPAVLAVTTDNTPNRASASSTVVSGSSAAAVVLVSDRFTTSSRSLRSPSWLGSSARSSAGMTASVAPEHPKILNAYRAARGATPGGMAAAGARPESDLGLLFPNDRPAGTPLPAMAPAIRVPWPLQSNGFESGRGTG